MSGRNPYSPCTRTTQKPERGYEGLYPVTAKYLMHYSPLKKWMSTTPHYLDIVLTLLCAVCGVLGDRHYIAIPVDGIDGIDVIKVNAIAHSLSRVAKQTKAYVPFAVSSISHQDDSEVQQRSERLATHVLDYVDFGGHTGSNGAFSWYADYPAHRS
ncbi:PREDICTED: uncharacterized protein LOC108769017 [Trachymyrmex cornetzi]|uniref:uncharacterized protein LOC108769017 n=1 Tax=Trachymyrmex cornetzi TaxID=471704 RepID=UPI00084F82E2|nr:PREDICTED: uncharacterized protein LOC108769017 [Trachymyrmex cornetzi]